MIGDAVNFASRIEQANKELGTQLLVSGQAYDEVRQQARAGREFADTSLKGKSGRYKLYEIIGLNTELFQRGHPEYSGLRPSVVA